MLLLLLSVAAAESWSVQLGGHGGPYRGIATATLERRLTERIALSAGGGLGAFNAGEGGATVLGARAMLHAYTATEAHRLEVAAGPGPSRYTYTDPDGSWVTDYPWFPSVFVGYRYMKDGQPLMARVGAEALFFSAGVSASVGLRF